MWPAQRDERRLRLRGLTAFDSNSGVRTLFRSHIAKRPLTEALLICGPPGEMSVGFASVVSLRSTRTRDFELCSDPT